MKTLCFILCLFTFSSISAQTNKPLVMELKAAVAEDGQIKMQEIPTKDRYGARDSTIDIAPMRKMILQNNAALYVIGKMAEEGWRLTGCMQIMTDKDYRPSYPFIIYYFQKDPK